jgi:hypothetical protein
MPTSPSTYSTVAFSLARLTFAEVTPGNRPRAFSTVAAQEAQVMPLTGMTVFFV